MAIDPNNYFAFWDIILYGIIGSAWLAIALGLVVIGFFCMKYTVPFQVTILLACLFLLVVSILTGFWGIYTLIVAAVFGFFYWIIARMLRRN